MPGSDGGKEEDLRRWALGLVGWTGVSSIALDVGLNLGSGYLESHGISANGVSGAADVFSHTWQAAFGVIGAYLGGGVLGDAVKKRRGDLD